MKGGSRNSTVLSSNPHIHLKSPLRLPSSRTRRASNSGSAQPLRFGASERASEREMAELLKIPAYGSRFRDVRGRCRQRRHTQGPSVLVRSVGIRNFAGLRPLDSPANLLRNAVRASRAESASLLSTGRHGRCSVVAMASDDGAASGFSFPFLANRFTFCFFNLVRPWFWMFDSLCLL